MRSLRWLAMPLLLGTASLLSAQIQRAPNGHFYQLVSAPNITWDAARAAAESTLRCGQPGHLVTITSLQEQTWLVSNFGGTALATKWMGAIQPDAALVGTGWEWVTGETFAFTQWGAGEPNNLLYAAPYGYESAGVFRIDGNWNDAPRLWNNYTSGGYVIEWDVDATVIIGECDTAVINAVVDQTTQCTISDLIQEAAASASNHGDFVSEVAKITNLLMKAGVITGEEKGRIQSCAARASIP